MDGSLLTLPRVYWIVSLGSDLAVVGLLVRALAWGAGPRSIVPWIAAGTLAAWGALSLALADAGIYHYSVGQPFPFIGLGVGLPILIFYGAVRLWRSLRAAVARIPQATLVGIQGFRLLGIMFVLAMLRGQLPRSSPCPPGSATSSSARPRSSSPTSCGTTRRSPALWQWCGTSQESSISSSRSALHSLLQRPRYAGSRRSRVRICC